MYIDYIFPIYLRNYFRRQWTAPGTNLWVQNLFSLSNNLVRHVQGEGDTEHARPFTTSTVEAYHVVAA